MEIEPLARATKSILHFVLPRGFATLENAIRNKQNGYEQQEDWNQRFGDRWTRGKHVERSQNQQSAQKCEVKGNQRLMQFKRRYRDGDGDFFHPTHKKLAGGLQNEPADQADDKPGECSQIPLNLDRAYGR